jgi:hypothetical protein
MREAAKRKIRVQQRLWFERVPHNSFSRSRFPASANVASAGWAEGWPTHNKE